MLRRRTGGRYLKDDVPFSCCIPSVLRPCVHEEMRYHSQHADYPVGDSTLYRHGCATAVRLYTARVGLWIVSGLGTLAGLALTLVVLCRSVSYMGYSRENLKIHTGFLPSLPFFEPILWGHSGPLCHALSLFSLSLWTSMRKRRATVAACDSSDTW